MAAIMGFMKTVKVGNLTLAYRDAGNPNNPALILLHGPWGKVIAEPRAH
jgi:pimeloyl-ACP methyl ester carboxylesterase